MTGAAEQRLITSGNTAGFATRASGGRTVRNGVLSLVLILLSALAVVQTAVVDEPRADAETTEQVVLGRKNSYARKNGDVPRFREAVPIGKNGDVPRFHFPGGTVGARAPRVLMIAVAQAAIGFGLAMLVHRLAPRAGLWVVLAVVLVALYPAAMVWPRVVENPRAQIAVWAPFATLVALAAVDAIPPIVHEAAAVDRAASWFKFRTITLPLVAPLLLLGVAFLVASGFRRPDARIVTAAYALLITAIVVGSGLARSRR